MMKIYVLGTRGFPDIQGGVEKHCESLYTRIAQKGFDITVAEGDLISLIESITAVIAGVMVVFGLFRKLFARKINQ